MSQGKQRNEAQAIAFICNRGNIPYAKAYRQCLLKFSFKRSFGSISDALAKLGRTIAESTYAINRLRYTIASLEEMG